jgi:hypothetical protein
MSARGGVELNTTYARSSAGRSMRRFHNDGARIVDERQARAAGRRRRPWAPVVMLRHNVRDVARVIPA